MKITISEAMSWRKTLQERHNELVALRAQNSIQETRMYGANVDKQRIIDPLYDVVALDKLVTNIAREINKLDQSIKKTNHTTELANYDCDDSILGELQAAKPKQPSGAV